MLMLWDMFSEWLEIGSMKQFKKKISSALHPGCECPCYVRKILSFQEWLLEALFLAANAGLWMCTYQLQEIAWNLELSRVEVEWNLPCHRTSCCFFFKICPHPWIDRKGLPLSPHARYEAKISAPCIASVMTSSAKNVDNYKNTLLNNILISKVVEKMNTSRKNIVLWLNWC